MRKSLLSPITGIVLAGIVLIIGFWITTSPVEHPSVSVADDVQPAGTFRTTNLVVDNTAQVLEPIGTVNVTPAALYVLGTVGIGDPPSNTPGTFLDIRHNWLSGWDDFELVEAAPNTANGVEIDYVRSYGTLSTHLSTTAATEISHVAVWGYDTNNAIAQGGRERWTVDQNNSVGAVPMRLDIWNANTTGTLQNAFRFDSGHHFSVLDGTAPALTSCGTSPSIVGSDQAGTITIGSVATGCTMTFHWSWATTQSGAAVHCTLTNRSGQLFSYTMSQTVLTITSIGPISSTLIDYTCIAAGVP